MRRKLYVHLGPSKTGTSAIQGFFRDETPSSILYPKTGRWPDGSHHKLPFAFNDKTQYGAINIPPWEQLFEELDKEISSSKKNILISTELSSLAFVKTLLSLLSKHNLDTRLVLTFRNPLERAASSYNQKVKDAVIGLTESPDEYLLRRQMDFCFKPLFEKWSALNLPLTVIPFRDELPLIQRFCSEINADVETFTDEKYPNKSMGGPALILMLIANKLLNNEIQRRVFFNQLRKDTSFKIWKGLSFPFSEMACNDFSNATKTDIDWIVDKFDFAPATLSSIDKKVFSLSKIDIQSIHEQLEKAGLAKGNQQLIASILKPFS